MCYYFDDIILVISYQTKNYMKTFQFMTFHTKVQRVHIWQQYFQIPAQKYANQACLVPNLRIFIFSPTFAIEEI